MDICVLFLCMLIGIRVVIGGVDVSFRLDNSRNRRTHMRCVKLVGFLFQLFTAQGMCSARGLCPLYVMLDNFY